MLTKTIRPETFAPEETPCLCSVWCCIHVLRTFHGCNRLQRPIMWPLTYILLQQCIMSSKYLLCIRRSCQSLYYGIFPNLVKIRILLVGAYTFRFTTKVPVQTHNAPSFYPIDTQGIPYDSPFPKSCSLLDRAPHVLEFVFFIRLTCWPHVWDAMACITAKAATRTSSMGCFAVWTKISSVDGLPKCPYPGLLHLSVHKSDYLFFFAKYHS